MLKSEEKKIFFNLKSQILIVLLLAIIPIEMFAQLDKSILKKSDDAYFPTLSKFNFTIKLYEDNEYDKYYELKCYIKGNKKYLAIFKNPPIVRRRAQLRIGDKIISYLAKINRTTEISAKAAFAGSTFSEEDILSASLGYFYDLEKVEEVNLDGRKVLKLFLKSRSKETSYYRIESFIDKKTLLPIKRTYYSFSNQKIKELKVIEIRKNKKGVEYIHLIMYDSLRKGTYAEVIMKDFEFPKRLDNRMFTKRYMEIATQ